MSNVMVEPAGHPDEGRRKTLDALASLDARPVLSGSLAFAVGVAVGDVAFGLAIVAAGLVAAFGTTRATPRSPATSYVLFAGVCATVFGLLFGQFADLTIPLSATVDWLPLNRVELMISLAPVVGVVWVLCFAALVARAFRLRAEFGGLVRDYIPQAAALAGAMLIAVLLLGLLSWIVLLFVLPAVLALSKRARPSDERDQVLLAMVALFSGSLLAEYITSWSGALDSAALTATIGIVLVAAAAWFALVPRAATRRGE